MSNEVKLLLSAPTATYNLLKSTPMLQQEEFFSVKSFRVMAPPDSLFITLLYALLSVFDFIQTFLSGFVR